MKNIILSPAKQKKRLRWILLLFFVLLSLPVYSLLQTVYSQLENEAYFTARHQAETLVDQIELKLKDLLEAEQSRPIAEYQFFNVMANPLLSESAGVKFSPLSEIPPKTEIEGLVGYFQINTDGSFHLPALPEWGQDNLSGLSLAELESRLLLKQKIRTLLSIKSAETQLVGKKDRQREEEKVKVEAVVKNQPYIEEFSQKTILMTNKISSSLDKLAKKKQKSKILNKPSRSVTLISKRKVNKPIQKKYNTRKETVQLPDQTMASNYFNRSQQNITPTVAEQENQRLEINSQVLQQDNTSVINVLSFESEVTPLQLLLIGQDYFCFYRYVWYDNNRYTQGFVVNIERFLKAVTSPLVTNSPFSSLIFSNSKAPIHISLWQREAKGGFLDNSSLSSINQEFELYKRALVTPFQKIEVFVNAVKLDNVPGSLVIDLLALSLFSLFFISFIVFYRLGSKQIELAKQQQNFISAVSHELKTPLTSIRMYGEMLRSGWVTDEEKKKTYYDFIFFESERLSRLITNVLQLARVGHQKEKADNSFISAQSLLDRIPSKIEAQIEASVFTLNIIQSEGGIPSSNVRVDEDSFFQIVINLIDNAIKFANKAELKQIDIGFKATKNRKHIIFFVRDYGSGIKKNQLKKIFNLFYRSEDELTRTTPGTGIGLALVAQLADSMQATCLAANKDPGAEFQIKFSVF